MSAFKEYTMMFQLNAKLGGSYSKAFKQAVQELEYFRILNAAGSRGSDTEAAGNAAAAI